MKVKNTFKKLGISLLAAVMSLGLLSSTASAYSDGTQTGSITVHKLASHGVSNDIQTGNEIENPEIYGQPLAGAGFALYSVAEADVTGTNGLKSVDTTSMQATLDTNPGEKVVPITLAKAEQTTDAAGETTFANLAEGYYILVETVVPKGYEASLPSLITMPLTKADGTGHLYDIHMYPKNISTDLITKTIDNATTIQTTNSGFTWTIDTALKASKDGTDYTVTDLKKDTAYGAFYITDILGKGLSYEKTSKFVFLNAAGNEMNVSLSENTDYTVDTTAVNGQVTWTLTEAGIDKAIANAAVKVRVQVSTKLNSYGTDGDAGKLTNKAIYGFKPAGSTEDPIEPEKPIIAEGLKANITVEKALSSAASAKNISLDGIKFALALNENPKMDNDADFLCGTDNKMIVVTTDANGYATFEGVPYDNTNGSTYYLVEIETKDGLQLKQNAIEVKLEKGKDSANLTDDYTVLVPVTNYLQTENDPDGPTFELPLTGSTGTMIFTVVGLGLMVGAVLLIVKSRKNKA